MASSQTVSVCITTYNSAATLRASLGSVLRQTRAPIEVLIADDASTDETVEVALESGDERVRVIRSGRNYGGPAWGRNAALSAAKGHYIAFLDADDVWREDKLDRQVETLCSTGTLASCSAAIAQGADGEYAYPVGLRSFDHQIGLLRLVLLNHVVASSAIVNREILSKVGGFPERAACIGFEDYCAWMKIAAHTRWAFITEPLVRYTAGAPSLRTTSHKSQAGIRIECRHELRSHMHDLRSARARWAFSAFAVLSSSAGHLSAFRKPWVAR